MMVILSVISTSCVIIAVTFISFLVILNNKKKIGTGGKGKTDQLSQPIHAETQSLGLVIGLSVAVAVLVIICVFLFCFGNWQLQKRKRDLQVKFDYDYEMMVKKKEPNNDKMYVNISHFSLLIR